jgi:serine/threonine-protein kinase RsbW
MMRTAQSIKLLSADTVEEDYWHVDCVSSFREMALVVEAMVIVLLEMGYPPKEIFAARLALEDAIGNAIKHGHQDNPSKVVEIRYCFHADQFLIEVRDQGPGFDRSQVPVATVPENLERPGGRGLLLTRHFAAWVRRNRKGNGVTFAVCHSELLPARKY